MTVEEFQRAIENLQGTLEDAVGPELHEHGKKVADKAAALLGDSHGEMFQPDMAMSLPAWEPLAEATIEKKIAGDTPLLESFALHDSITTETLQRPGPAVRSSGGGRAIWVESIGSSLEYAAVQEDGSKDGRIPPRSYLKRALAMLHVPMVLKIDEDVDAVLDKVFR